jgi:arylsulfatase
VRWPNGFHAKGEARSQFHHVIDVAATVLDAAQIPHPTMVHGVLQDPIHGVSMRYCFDDALAGGRHETQYFEMLCNRGIYHKGWTAVTRHAIPWIIERGDAGVDEDVWELYDTPPTGRKRTTSRPRCPTSWPSSSGCSRSRRPSTTSCRWTRASPSAGTGHRRPADPGERQQPAPVRRQHRLQENVVLNVKNKSHSVTAEIDVPDDGAQGVIIAQGGDTGGWSLYAHQGRLTYCYNLLGFEHYYTHADAMLPSGTHQARMEFTYDGGGFGKGGDVTLYVDGEKVAAGRVERSHKQIFSMDETTEVGSDAGSTVSEDYGPRGNAFNGTIGWLQLDIDAAVADQDHLIAPEERFRLAMAKQ